MQNIGFSDIEITGGYWKTRQEINSEVTLKSVYERFKETHRFDSIKCEWKDGEPNMPHIFWDSDVAKWSEGAAYILNSKEDETITEIIENAIDCIIENSDENGYFNSHFLVTDQNNRFCNRECHELYCAGHLIEAAVAYYQATGKDRFLKAMCKYADYIEKVFKIEKSAAFITPGHPELELALMRLYRATGEKRYADLAKYFIDEHGKHAEERIVYEWATEYYNQDDMPIRDRKTAEGHCVRALYLMCGAADVAYEYGDDELKKPANVSLTISLISVCILRAVLALQILAKPLLLTTICPTERHMPKPVQLYPLPCLQTVCFNSEPTQNMPMLLKEQSITVLCREFQWMANPFSMKTRLKSTLILTMLILPLSKRSVSQLRRESRFLTVPAALLIYCDWLLP